MSKRKNSSKEKIITARDFAEELNGVQDWFDLGIFLGVQDSELRQVEVKYKSIGNNRCLLELFILAERMDIYLSWTKIADALEKMKYNLLANNIRKKYTFISRTNSTSSADLNVFDTEPAAPTFRSPLTSLSSNDHEPNDTGLREHISTIPHHIELNLQCTYQIESVQFCFSAFETCVVEAIQQDMSTSTLQTLIRSRFQIQEIPSKNASVIKILERVREQCKHQEYFRFLENLVNRFLSGNVQYNTLEHKIHEYYDQSGKAQAELSLEILRSNIPHTGTYAVQMKLHGEWGEVSLKQFDVWIKDVFKRSYPHLRLMRVTEGCICVSWLTTDTKTVLQDIEKAQSVLESDGVISVHVGGNIVFHNQETPKPFLVSEDYNSTQTHTIQTNGSPRKRKRKQLTIIN